MFLLPASAYPSLGPKLLASNVKLLHTLQADSACRILLEGVHCCYTLTESQPTVIGEPPATTHVTSASPCTPLLSLDLMQTHQGRGIRLTHGKVV